MLRVEHFSSKFRKHYRNVGTFSGFLDSSRDYWKVSRNVLEMFHFFATLAVFSYICIVLNPQVLVHIFSHH